MEKKLTFDDVLIEPQFSDIKSRSEVSLATNLGNWIDFRLPIISANMDTVTGVVMANAMHELGGLGILHRFYPIDQNVDAFVQVMQHNGRFCAVSFGNVGA